MPPPPSSLNSALDGLLTFVCEAPIRSAILLAAFYVFFKAFNFLVIEPWRSPLHQLQGPPKIGRFFDLRHLRDVMDPMISNQKQDEYVRAYGKNMRIQGFGYWDQRLLTFDTRAIHYILVQATEIYPKAWQSRRILSRLLGEGVAVTEGEQHRRQRKVMNPAFAPQVLRQLHPIFHSKAEELRDRWAGIIGTQRTEIDINHWVGRATFDAFALAGFGYKLNAIQNEDNELYLAYKKMFDVAVNKGQTIRGFLEVHFPWIDTVFPNEGTRQIKRSQEIIQKAAAEMLKSKKDAIILNKMASKKDFDSEAFPVKTPEQKDILTLFIKANLAEASPNQRISDAELIAQIHSMLFVGSDSVGLSVLWTLHFLALDPELQNRLREELLPFAPFGSAASLDIDSAGAFPFLDAVAKETLRLCPPLQSTLRVADSDDVIPTEDGTGVKIRKGTFVHLPLEGLNQDKNVWGEDAWEYRPDRWFNLPEAAKRQPGLVSGLMTFSIGSHSCPAARFAMIEMKCFLATLISSFVFTPVPDKRIFKCNTVVTRPFVFNEWQKGPQLPMLVEPYVPTP